VKILTSEVALKTNRKYQKNLNHQKKEIYKEKKEIALGSEWTTF
jgi:hypothetical protein